MIEFKKTLLILFFILFDNFFYFIQSILFVYKFHKLNNAIIFALKPEISFIDDSVIPFNKVILFIYITKKNSLLFPSNNFCPITYI